MIKLNEKEVEKRFRELYNGEYSLISKFEKTGNPATLKHICGHEYSVQRLTRFFNGTGGLCPICRSKDKKKIVRTCKVLTEEVLIKRIKDELNDEIEYISGLKDRNSQCSFKCKKCSSIFTKSPHTLFSSRNNIICPSCHQSKRGYYENPETYLEDSLSEAIDGNEYEWLEEFKGSSRVKHKIRHIKCGHEYSVKPYYFRHNDKIRCPHCATKRSKIEKELFDFIYSLNNNAKYSERKIISPYELDIFIPEKNIAFEMNGLYWHSEKRVGRKYHQDKLKKCNENGIRLIQIFEDEWINKKDIVKSKIKSILGVSSEKRIYARKCSARKLNYDEYFNFFEKNHIQGGIPLSVSYGLFYNDELVAAIGFNKLRSTMNSGNNQDAWDLIRYATDINSNVIGGCGKLINFFIKNEKCSYIKTLADLRWSDENNNMYIKLGFKESGRVDPRYFYSDGTKRVSRFNFRKQEIKRKFPEIYNEKMTEFEMMDKTSYFRIWDYGKITYEIIF